jgi:O-antigen ligase
MIAMLEERAAGMFRLAREYRFPTGGATKQSEHSVLLAFSATYLYHVGYLGNAATVLLVGTAFVLLFLTRTLNSFWPAVGAAVLWFALQSDALQGSAWLTGGVGCLVVLGLLCLGSSRWRDRLVGVLFLGREFSNWLTLSSRTPIWSYALRSVPARPVLGFGYGGFWNSHRSGEAAQSFGWTNPVSTSCSLYVEALVNTGVIGLALFMSVFIAGYAAAFRLPMAECGFMLAVMTYVTLHSGFNTTFALPSFRAFALFLLLFGM